MPQVKGATCTLIFLPIWFFSYSLSDHPGNYSFYTVYFVLKQVFVAFVKVGSFLMGWFGVVFKADISKISDNLAIGLSTGFLGSLTTFSGWNQKMLDLSVEGHWVFSILGILLGDSL